MEEIHKSKLKEDKQPKLISIMEWIQAWSPRLLICKREFVEKDIVIITRMNQFLQRKCTGTYQISISISEAIKVGGNMKYVIWGNRGERKSQIPRLISLPVSAPFLVQYAPKILYILMVMFMMGFYPLFCPSRVGQEEGWWWVLLHFLFPLQGTSAQSFSPRPFYS